MAQPLPAQKSPLKATNTTTRSRLMSRANTEESCDDAVKFEAVGDGRPKIIFDRNRPENGRKKRNKTRNRQKNPRGKFFFQALFFSFMICPSPSWAIQRPSRWKKSSSSIPLKKSSGKLCLHFLCFGCFYPVFLSTINQPAKEGKKTSEKVLFFANSCFSIFTPRVPLDLGI